LYGIRKNANENTWGIALAYFWDKKSLRRMGLTLWLTRIILKKFKEA